MVMSCCMRVAACDYTLLKSLLSSSRLEDTATGAFLACAAVCLPGSRRAHVQCIFERSGRDEMPFTCCKFSCRFNTPSVLLRIWPIRFRLVNYTLTLGLPSRDACAMLQSQAM